MKKSAGTIFLLGMVMLFLQSCAEFQPTLKLQKTPVSTGELRLLSLQVPEQVGEDLPYDVQVTFEAAGQPRIKRVCFMWVSEKVSVPSPSLYCYAWEAQTDKDIGSTCTRWLADGPYAQSSPAFCTKVESIEYGSPGHLMVKIRTQNVEQVYNRLECYAEYLHGGETDITNKVSARVKVEKLGQ